MLDLGADTGHSSVITVVLVKALFANLDHTPFIPAIRTNAVSIRSCGSGAVPKISALPSKVALDTLEVRGTSGILKVRLE